LYFSVRAPCRFRLTLIVMLSAFDIWYLSLKLNSPEVWRNYDGAVTNVRSA
jgi:hypothetical protein